MKRQSLNGKVVFVTGAARGIGEHSARLAAARGARVALVGLEGERLRARAAELGGDHLAFEADVTDQDAVDGAVAQTVERLGGIDVVVANAGIASNGTVAITPADVLARGIEVNLLGVVRTVSAALPHVTARRGYVLIVSSAAAFSGLPGMAAYCASKAGVEQFGNILRLEVAHRGVAVGTLHPSWIDTDLVRDQKAELSVFSDALATLPWPMGETTSLGTCAEAVIDAIERRRRRIYVPRTVGIVQALRSVVNSPLGDLLVRRRARTMVPRLEAEVEGLGRWFGRQSVGMARGAEGGHAAARGGSSVA
jgi:NAD(P)-dependent dehydrogenase (short-subunit alcohol dehydrogenase family)